MSDERSERLRRNRNRAKERVQSSAPPDEPAQSDNSSKRDEPSKPGEPSEPNEPSKSGKSSESDEPSETSVKDERVGTYMYLPDSQQSELSRLYNVLKAEYEYEYDATFEKNRHFYPLVIEFGKNSLDGLDASDIQDKLEMLDVASDPGDHDC